VHFSYRYCCEGRYSVYVPLKCLEKSGKSQGKVREFDHDWRMVTLVPVYSPAFDDTHCASPWRDGQAELTWVTGYILRWFTRPEMVTHPSTNRAWHRATSLIETKLPLGQLPLA